MPRTTTTDTLTLANRLRPLLLRLNRHLRREVHAVGVTGGQVSLLAHVQQRPGLGVRELAALEGISAPGTSKAVDRLERAGLVRREAGSDRRRVGLVVTDEGERVLRSVRSRRTAWLAARLKRLSEDELEALDRAVEPLTRLLETEDE